MSHDHGKEEHAQTIAAQARECFGQAVESLDAGAANRLRLLRREALGSPRRRARAWLLPVGAVAATALVATFIWRAPNGAAIPPTHPIVIEDVAPLEFPSEDEAELYAWLGEAPVASPEGSAL